MWLKAAPAEGWYWVKYVVDKKRRVCPAYFTCIDPNWIVRTGRNDGFRTYDGKVSAWCALGESKVHRSFRIWSEPIAMPPL